MADTTITVHRGDEFRVGTVGFLYGRVHVGDELLVAAREPETLERLGEAFIEAGRDLRFAIIAENERRAGEDGFLASDDTSSYLAEMAARRRAEELDAQHLVEDEVA